MRKVIELFGSLKLTVVLLALSMVLVFAGTLAQVDKGIWTVMAEYFRCFIAFIELPVFFPRSWNVPDLKIPFPGGFLIGWLLVINLLTVHGARFKLLAEGKRRPIGFAVLGLGVLVTIGVMQGWGTTSVAATENDAFWRVFWRLGRGTLAAVVLYAGCRILYRQRAGMVLLHAGILFLMIGEFFTALHAVEANMTIAVGETVGYVDQSQHIELAFIDEGNSDFNTVTVVPEGQLKTGGRISTPQLPFDIRINQAFRNSSQPRALSQVPETQQTRYPAYSGIGSSLYVAGVPEVSGTGGARNAPAVDVELIDRQTGESLGRYIFSIWFYPNFVNRAWDRPQIITYGDKTYRVYLRSKREYLTSPSGSPFSIQLHEFVHEKYEGTQTPKDFASRITLVNEGDDVERDLRIWMNNPLRYARRTFYQSGYLPNDGGTVLQVVRNDTWMIPYLSCMIVFVGMAAQFWQSLRRSQRKDV